jgi:hypothetical protein
MAFRKTVENTAVTLPLDVVLEVIRGTRGEPVSSETMALLQLDVGHAICSLPIEPEVAEGMFRQTFGAWVS